MDLFLKITGVIQWIAFVIGMIAIIGCLVLFFKIIRFLRNEHHALMNPYAKPETVEEARDMYADDWKQIKKFAQSMQESEWKLAVIQADKLVDEMLRVKGYEGESMGERLKNMDPNRFLTLQELWEAHKLRNQLVHEPGFNLSKQQAGAAIQSYENFLRELGAFT